MRRGINPSDSTPGDIPCPISNRQQSNLHDCNFSSQLQQSELELLARADLCLVLGFEFSCILEAVILIHLVLSLWQSDPATATSLPNLDEYRSAGDRVEQIPNQPGDINGTYFFQPDPFT
ncbi:hypothetical protein [Rhizobium mayense]|uniref:hypothetical protein n=1 Tax=Rhizobium mayense TaxID=1312184 RepID=UPI00398C422E